MSDGLPRELEDLVDFFPLLSRGIVSGVLASVGPDHAFENLLAFSDDAPSRGGVVLADPNQFSQEMFRKEVLQVRPEAATAVSPGVHPAGVETFFMCTAAVPSHSRGGRPRLEDQGAALVAAYGNSSVADLQGVGWDTPNRQAVAPTAPPHPISASNGIYASPVPSMPLHSSQDANMDAFEPWDEAPPHAEVEVGVITPNYVPNNSILAPSPVISFIGGTPGNTRTRPAYSPPPLAAASPFTATPSAPFIMPIPIPIPDDENAQTEDRNGPMEELWESSDLPTNVPPTPTPAVLSPSSSEGTLSRSLIHLIAMFPEKNASVVERVLWDCEGSVEDALETLISMSGDGTHSGSPPISISGSESADEEIPRSQALQLLALQFEGLEPQEIECALDGVHGSLHEAACLLQIYTEEDQHKREAAAKEAADRDMALHLQRAEAAVSTPSAPPRTPVSSTAPVSSLERGVPETPSTGDARFAAKVKHLQSSFPSTPETEIAGALIRAQSELPAARKILKDRGFVESLRSPIRVAAPAAVHANIAALDADGRYVPRPMHAGGGGSSGPVAGLSHMARHNRDYHQRHADSDKLYTEARAASNALYDESSKCFRNANAAYRDGDYRLSDDLTAKGKDLKRRAHEERKLAAETISRVKNKALGSVISVDLHGLHVDEALAKVQSVLDQVFNGLRDVVSAVRIITGKGNHSSDGPRLLPAVMQWLYHHKVPFVDCNGSLEIPIS